MQSFAAEHAIANLTGATSGYTRDTGITAKNVSLIMTIAKLEIKDRTAHYTNNGQHNSHNHFITTHARSTEL